MPIQGLAYREPLSFYLCGQPAQQHGRRLPPASCMTALFICSTLVSSLLTDSTQQIHSLRASGVISSQASKAFILETRASCKSFGTLCTTPLEICFLFIIFNIKSSCYRRPSGGLLGVVGDGKTHRRLYNFLLPEQYDEL